MTDEEPLDPNTLYADGFEDALIGLGWQHTKLLAVYDYNKCVRVLIEREEMTHEEAIEWMEYNVVGSWVGEYTPIFLMSEDEMGIEEDILDLIRALPDEINDKSTTTEFKFLTVGSVLRQCHDEIKQLREENERLKRETKTRKKM